MNEAIGRYGTVGLEVVFAILLGFIFGRYLDDFLGTAPWLTVFMTLSGIGAAIKALVRMTRLYQNEVRSNKEQP